MTRARVLHIQKVAGIGGSERHLLSLLPALQQRGIEVLMCVMKSEGSLEFEEALRRANVPVTAFPAGLDVSMRAFIRIARVLRSFRPHIVHTHLLHANLHGQLPAWLFSCPGVVSVHSAHSLEVRQPFRAATALPLRTARRVIAISHYVARLAVRKQLVPPERVRMIHYGVDPSDWRANGTWRETNAGSFSDLKIAVVGRLIPGKGHEWLLRAFAEARERIGIATLHVAGTGILRGSLEALARGLQISDHVSFHGHVSEIERFLEDSDVLVVPTMPTLNEGFGLSALEGMAAGCCVVASRTGPLPELIEHEQSGFLVEPGNVDDLAGVLVQAGRSRKIRRDLGTAARRRAFEHFSLDSMVGRTMSVYEEVLERHLG